MKDLVNEYKEEKVRKEKISMICKDLLDAVRDMNTIPDDLKFDARLQKEFSTFIFFNNLHFDVNGEESRSEFDSDIDIGLETEDVKLKLHGFLKPGKETVIDLEELRQNGQVQLEQEADYNKKINSEILQDPTLLPWYSKKKDKESYYFDFDEEDDDEEYDARFTSILYRRGYTLEQADDLLQQISHWL